MAFPVLWSVCRRCATRLKQWSPPLVQGLQFPACRRHTDGAELIMHENSTVMGIETSCDDTGVAVVDVRGNILGEALCSQLDVHMVTGGVVPHVAGQLHRENLHHVTQLALERSGQTLDQLSAIAVTTGPGLAPCLKAGLEYAKELVRKTDKPLVSVHHMEAHALTPRIENDIPFPYLVLLVSGGHCILAVTHGPGEFKRLGSSKDDSPGEALDKVARWLHLDRHPEVGHLPGGAAIEVLAERGDWWRYSLPNVMARSWCCDFSFAGLKTAAKKIITTVKIETEEWDGSEPLTECEHIAASFQEAVCRHLIARTHRAILFCKQKTPQVKDLVVSGGVASNQYLYSLLQRLASGYGYRLHCPPPRLCTDNGVMIAWSAVEQLKAGQEVVADLERLDFRPRWPLGEDVSEEVKNAQLKLPRLSH